VSVATCRQTVEVFYCAVHRLAAGGYVREAEGYDSPVATCRQTVVRKNKIFEEVGFDVTLRTPEWNSIDMNLWRFGDENQTQSCRHLFQS
jgi:hypothetical protein